MRKASTNVKTINETLYWEENNVSANIFKKNVLGTLFSILLNSSATCSSSSDFSSSEDESDVVITKVTQGETDKTSTLENLADYHFDLIINPTGWLDCDIIQQAHVLLQLENPAISGFQRTTLGPVRNFNVVSGELVQILHTGNSHWMCASICKPF